MKYDEIQDLEDRYSKFISRAQQVNKIAEDRNEPKNPEEQAKFDSYMKDAETVALRLKDAKRLYSAGLDTEQRSNPFGKEMAEERADKAPKIDPEQALNEYRTALQDYVLTGRPSALLRNNAGKLPKVGKNGESRAVIQTTTPASSAPVGPSLFWADYLKAMKANVSILDYGARQVNTDNGNPYYIPFVDDTANTARITAEATGRTIATIPTLSAPKLQSYNYNSDIFQVSVEMIRDNIAEFESLLLELCSERIARKVATDTFAGDGSAKCTGFTYGVTPSVTTASSTTAVSFAELSNMVMAMSLPYRKDPSTRIFVPAGMISQLRAYTAGTLIFPPGSEIKIEGIPVVECQDMVTPAATTVAAAIVTCSKYFFRTVGIPQVLVYRELYRASGNIGISVESFHDGLLADANACCTLKMHA